MINICISATSSNSGKTILSTALLYHYKNSVRPFKIGPDYIDPQFHKKVCATASVNLDSFIMNDTQVQWLYHHYSDKKVSVLEGVMGFYDGLDKGCSAYDLSKLLEVPTLLLLDCQGSYVTVSAVLAGLKSYKKDNTIKAVVLNHISSEMHFELIKKIINDDHKDIVVLGWIEDNLPTLKDTHLGLDLEDLSQIESISQEVLKHIDLSLLESFAQREEKEERENYPFEKIEQQDRHLAIVNDANFSFLYYDNLMFLETLFKKVTVVSAIEDAVIPSDADVVYICGGYVEPPEAYKRIKNANNFKKSLMHHSQTKKIYAECAGLLYLGNCVDEKEMSGILDVDFTLEKRFTRLGYYYNEKGIKGHSFHYTKARDDAKGFDVLSKNPQGRGSVGSWESAEKNVFGTYLHTMFRNNIELIQEKFL